MHIVYLNILLKQHFATDAGGARLAVGHYALGRGDDGHTEAVHDLGQRLAAAVDAQAGAAHALDALDDRAAGVVLEGDFEFGLAAVVLQGEAVDVALVLQHLRDRDLDLRSRHREIGRAHV